MSSMHLRLQTISQRLQHYYSSVALKLSAEITQTEWMRRATGRNSIRFNACLRVRGRFSHDAHTEECSNVLVL